MFFKIFSLSFAYAHSPEQVRKGRNKVLAEHASHLLPYRGMGTGIPRELHAWPKIELIDDREGNEFKAVAWRASAESIVEQSGTKSGSSRDQVVTKSTLTQEQSDLLAKMRGEHAITDLMAWAERSNRSKFRNQLLRPLLLRGLIEMTIPDKPNSSKQRYRLTIKGAALAR